MKKNWMCNGRSGFEVVALHDKWQRRSSQLREKKAKNYKQSPAALALIAKCFSKEYLETALLSQHLNLTFFY